MDQFEQLAARAEQLGTGPFLAAVYQHVIDTLQTRPRKRGDPYHNYRVLNATGYAVAILSAGLGVEYAVHNTAPVV